LGGHFDIEGIKDKLKSLEEEVSSPDIWNNVEAASALNIKIGGIKSLINKYDELDKSITDNIDMLELFKDDEENLSTIEKDLNRIKEEVNDFEVTSLLNNEFDSYNCYLEIHPGAGGTESCDWASMLYRMYTLYLDKNNIKYTIINKQDGDTAGIKSCMIKITMPYAYGYFKGEAGIHRLVRISPFNAQGKRQTSFAAVNVTPEIEEVPKDFVINDEDIRIDITRASGNGGQGVNTTDSAVRVTHIPTGIVIYSQQERSQLRNKEIAMNILRSKLYQLEKMKRKEEIDSLKDSSNINFGSQIRNYVLDPYKLVKDLRTGYESSQVDKVLDGDIYPLLVSYIRMKR